jgi:hypothetical protein
LPVVSTVHEHVIVQSAAVLQEVHQRRPFSHLALRVLKAEAFL